jgi:hypothetical protein
MKIFIQNETKSFLESIRTELKQKQTQSATLIQTYKIVSKANKKESKTNQSFILIREQ